MVWYSEIKKQRLFLVILMFFRNFAPAKSVLADAKHICGKRVTGKTGSQVRILFSPRNKL